MPTIMAERIRLIIDTDDDLRRAIKLRLLRGPAGATTSDLVNEILRKALADEVAEVQSYPRPEGEPGGKARRPRGRPRKKAD